MTEYTVPFSDLRAILPNGSADNDFSGMRRVLESGRYLLGEQTSRFEFEFRDYLLSWADDYWKSVNGMRCIAVASGFDALQLILRQAGIGEGNAVLVPSFAPAPVWMAVSIVGATPIPVEPSIGTFNITPQTLLAAIKKYDVNRRYQNCDVGIIAVHLFGRPLDLFDIEFGTAIENLSHFVMIEDCSQAHGATLPCGGRPIRVGNFCEYAAFSFYPTKNIGAYGDAGLVVANHKTINEEADIRDMAQYGRTHMIGINSRMDELQAAVLREKLKDLDKNNEIRRMHAANYLRRLAGLPGIKLPADHTGHVWHQFVILAKDREKLRKYLEEHGIETMVHYKSCPANYPVYKHYEYKTPVAEWLCDHVLSLPIGPHLTAIQQESVCLRIIKFVEEERYGN